MAFGILPTRVDTTAQYPLGMEADDPRATDFPGNRIRYVRADSAVAAGDAVILDVAETDQPGAVTPVSAVDQAVEGIAQVAIAADSYGWICIHGKVLNAKVGTSVAADDTLVSTATAGTLATASAADAGDATSRGRVIKALDDDTAGVTAVYIM